MTDEKTITWGELLRVTAKDLGNQQEARWLCEHASGLDRVEFDTSLDELVGERSGDSLRKMVSRRLSGEPLQYVMSRWSFRHLDVLVDKRVLIPRPETELVVQAAVDLANVFLSGSDKKIRIADLGTGSGVIGLCLASELPRGRTEVWLTDSSHEALDVARANLAGLGLVDGDVRVAHGSWFDAFASSDGVPFGSFDLIVSNPPYLAHGDSSVESIVRDYEPHVALFAGDDGLDAYREIVSSAREWLAPGGWLVLEIGHDQGDSVRELLQQNHFRNLEIRQDFAARDRIALAQN